MIQFFFTKRNQASVFAKFGGINWSGLAELLNGWKPDTRGYITVHKVGKSKSPAELGYYYGVILPMAFEAFSAMV